MASSNVYFSQNWRLRWDYYLGGRAAALIFYGTLPSSLAALDALKVPEIAKQPTNVLLPLSAIAVIPCLVLYLQIRQRLKAWYLMDRYLEVRAAALALTILLLSTTVWLAARFAGHGISQITVQALLQSLLVALVVLVASSTLFATAIKDDSGLPLLPTKNFVGSLGDLRKEMQSLQTASIWDSAEDAGAPELTDILAKIDDLLSDLHRLSPANSGRRNFYQNLRSDFKKLKEASYQVAQLPSKWKMIFDQHGEVHDPHDFKLREAVQSIRRVSIDVR